MRLEARVLEGDETRKVLVPLCTLLAFKQENDGKGVNHFINASRDPESDVDFDDWEPWLAWRTMVDRAGEERSFDDWLAAIEWAAIYQGPDELDPSGGEATQTPAPSPASSSGRTALGRSSSASTTTSSKPSGKSSKA
jgi:hypothetical protein